MSVNGANGVGVGPVFGGRGISIDGFGFIHADGAEGGTFVEPGGSAAANVALFNTIAAAGGLAVLGPFTYDIDAPVTTTRMLGVEGETVLRWTGPAGSFASGASGLDFASNAMVKVQGTLNPAKLNAVPTNVASGGVGYYPPGSQAISIDALDSVAVGDWILYRGANDPAIQQYDASAGTSLVWSDLLQVDAIQAPLTLLLEQHTLSYHTLTKGASPNPEQIAIQAVTPVLGPTFRGIIFDGGGIAVGVLLDYVVDALFEGCAFQNFAAVGALVRWSTGITFDNCQMAGALSGFVLADATHRGVITDTRSADTGLRYPTVGHGYGAVALRNDCSEWRIRDNDFAHFSIGLNLSGFRDLQLSNNKFRDLDCVEYRARDIADPSLYLLGVIGIAVHHGAVNLAIACFNPGFSEVGTMIVDARTDRGTFITSDDCSYWLHDVYQANISALSILNKGKSPYQNVNGLVRYMLGLRTQDWQGVVDTYCSVGCEAALRVNSSFGGTFSHVRLTSTPAQGTVPVAELFIESPWTQTTFLDLETPSILFDAAVMATLDYSECRATGITINGWFFRGPGVIAQNTTGAVRAGGDIVSYSNASATFNRLLVLQNNAAAQGLRKVIANQGGFGAPSGGFCFAESFPTYGRITCDATAVTLGADLKVVGGASVAVSPAGAGAKVASAEQVKAAVVGTILAGF